eukprot:TRINITY_DN27925_c0_g2_i1.p1 TRINITY_DN27925_c0_g2~~TRINITY_DN27925_c0_g2_i1.p1  ORF type:complete len:228 (+),score=26.43 TRINITY_DN27925_c0_g2_i1:50-733(+)
MLCVFFFQAEDGIRDAQESRGLGDVYKRQFVQLLSHGLRSRGGSGPHNMNFLPAVAASLSSSCWLPEAFSASFSQFLGPVLAQCEHLELSLCQLWLGLLELGPQHAPPRDQDCDVDTTWKPNTGAPSSSSPSLVLRTSSSGVSHGIPSLSAARRMQSCTTTVACSCLSCHEPSRPSIPQIEAMHVPHLPIIGLGAKRQRATMPRAAAGGTLSMAKSPRSSSGTVTPR